MNLPIVVSEVAVFIITYVAACAFVVLTVMAAVMFTDGHYKRGIVTLLAAVAALVLTVAIIFQTIGHLPT